MEEPFDSLAKIFIGALLATLFAIWRERSRDREARDHAETTAKEGRKRDFRVSMTALRDNILADTDDRLIACYKASFPRFREECAKVEPDISNVEKFKTAREEYLNLTDSDIQCPDQNAKPPPPRDAYGNYCPGNNLGWTRPCRYELGRAKIKNRLDAVIDCIG